VPAHCVVTGSSGFVGQRLVEMLVERGAKTVVAFDIAPKPGNIHTLLFFFGIHYVGICMHLGSWLLSWLLRQTLDVL